MDYSLSDKWVLWAHLPHDTDWGLKSYYRIHDFDNLKDSILLNNSFSDDFIRNCMLFLMRKGIKPTWEDIKNRNGGCFSYKVSNKIVTNAWKNLSYTLVGESLTNDTGLRPHINGITISPKKNFCIIKIWCANCDYKNPGLITNIEHLTSHGCLFKKHNPEY